ncbi:hypothetical protein Misp06_00472 [Microbulbifer sp. NBRC 101763]|uniref:hypothetical protein n=1 Tax=Microbulbifer sp. NBRC 101763 TaxID=1113820 RepID=UPI0030A2B00C
MFTAGSFKKVQFCAVLLLALSGMQAAEARAVELGFSVEDIHRQLTEKTDLHFMAKLNECKAKADSQSIGFPYPVHVAEDKPKQGATPSPYSKGRLTVM